MDRQEKGKRKVEGRLEVRSTPHQRQRFGKVAGKVQEQRRQQQQRHSRGPVDNNVEGVRLPRVPEHEQNEADEAHQVEVESARRTSVPKIDKEPCEQIQERRQDQEVIGSGDLRLEGDPGRVNKFGLAPFH